MPRLSRGSCVSAPASAPRRDQRGISLIEGLISILLVSIVGLGLAFITTKALRLQGYLVSETRVILAMRDALLDSSATGVRIAVGTGEDRQERRLTWSNPDDPDDPDFRTTADLSFTIEVGDISHTVDVPAQSLRVSDPDKMLIGGNGEMRLDY